MVQKVKAVFFDMGGTLVYDVGFEEALSRNLASFVEEKLGLRVEREKVLSLWNGVGDSWRDVELWDLARAMLFLRKLGATPRPVLAEGLYARVLESYVEGFRLEPCAEEVFSKLKEMGLLLGVITNVGSYEIVSRRLAEVGLLDYVDVLVASQAFGWRKPSEEIFRVACWLAGQEPSMCVHVGDDPVADVLGAKKVGIRAIQVLRVAKYRSDSADAYVNSVSEVPSVVRSWLSSE
ncbi:HAD family hydrolase [Infirmifilum sp. SLHALR2]|nr:MAG: hypothetical protein B7L53_04450 [Thermofilum sp. NZ13]